MLLLRRLGPDERDSCQLCSTDLVGGGAEEVVEVKLVAQARWWFLKDRLGDQRGGSEWEPIKILLEGD
jgi:hypothetical protein